MPSIKELITNMMPANTSVFVNPNARTLPIAPPQAQAAKVPKQFAGAVSRAAAHTGIPMDTVIRHFTAENGGVWDPTLRGRQDPNDFGVTQLNPLAVGAITGTGYKGAPDFFRQNFGRAFNPTSGDDQILGAAVYLNRLRQFDLPEAGIKKPTNKDVLLSYNLGARNYAASLQPNAPAEIVARRERYERLLKKHGIDLTNL